MKRFVTDATDEQHLAFKRYCFHSGHDMQPHILQLIGRDMREHGLLFPGYEPEECPNKICSFPYSQHSYTPASATEPGEWSCPILKDEDLPY